MCLRRKLQDPVQATSRTRYSLHTVTLRGGFFIFIINIPISGGPDCLICGNKLGSVFDVGVEKHSDERKHNKILDSNARHIRRV